MPCYTPLFLGQAPGSKKLVSAKNAERGTCMILPCGRCIGCRLERSRQQALRCWHEAQMNAENSFLTLTYRTDELLYLEDSVRPSLYPRHLTLFWKRLRKEVPNASIRYFACGEYGGQSNRPHYHACLFGLDFKDKKFHTIKNGNRLYRSDMLDHIWGHGNCLIGAVTFESAAYVARYICDKKLGEDSTYYDEQGIEPEFVRMSRRPGIGAKWLDKYYPEVFPGDSTYIRGGIETKPPRYYLNRFKKLDPLLYEQISYARKLQAKTDYNNAENHGARLKVRGQIAALKLKDIPRSIL